MDAFDTLCGFCQSPLSKASFPRSLQHVPTHVFDSPPACPGLHVLRRFAVEAVPASAHYTKCAPEVRSGSDCLSTCMKRQLSGRLTPTATAAALTAQPHTCPLRVRHLGLQTLDLKP